MKVWIRADALEMPGVLQGMGTALTVIFLILMGSFHPIFAAAAFFAVCYILLRYETGSMLLLFLMMPFAGIFKLSPGSTSLFTYLELIYCLSFSVKRRFRLSKADLMLTVLAFCMVLAQLISGTAAITNMIKVLLNLLLLEEFLRIFRPELRKKLYLWFFAGVFLSSATSLLLSRIFPIARFLTLSQVEQYGRYGERVIRFAGLSVDPNYYTVNVILSLCLLLMLYRRRELSTWRTVVLAGVLAAFAGLTGSKSAFLMLGTVVVLYLLACWQGKRYRVFAVSCVVLAGMLAAILSGQIPLFHGTLVRLQRSLKDVNSLTTGRAGVWLSYLRYFLSHPEKLILGRGVGIYVLNGRASHNTALDLLYQLGTVGTGFYLYSLSCMVCRTSVAFHRTLINYSGILCVMMMYFFLSQLQGYDLPFHLFLCVSLWNTRTTETSLLHPDRMLFGRTFQ